VNFKVHTSQIMCVMTRLVNESFSCFNHPLSVTKTLQMGKEISSWCESLSYLEREWLGSVRDHRESDESEGMFWPILENFEMSMKCYRLNETWYKMNENEKVEYEYLHSHLNELTQWWHQRLLYSQIITLVHFI
jgi:hypothetical protein